mgnify:CR=1 FL=1
MKKILNTGTAGFIGFHLAKKLLSDGYEVVGLDNINDYYDIDLKFGRLEQLGIAKDKISEGVMIKSQKYPNHSFVKYDLTNKDAILNLFKRNGFLIVMHLAAQAGVRYSQTASAQTSIEWIV